MAHAGETLLVTGFPGFHARKLCFQLLQSEPSLQLVLVRRAADAEASATQLAELQPAQRERVVEIEGDPAALDFGLSGSDYRQLAESVQRVYHFASQLEAGQASAQVATTNIACAREVLEFAAAASGLRGVVLLSSVSVSGVRNGVI